MGKDPQVKTKQTETNKQAKPDVQWSTKVIPRAAEGDGISIFKAAE